MLYASIMILVHHLALFYIEVFRFNEFFSTLWRVILSSITTFVIIMISQFLFTKPKTER
jgi:hypothetical protein